MTMWEKFDTLPLGTLTNTNFNAREYVGFLVTNRHLTAMEAVDKTIDYLKTKYNWRG